MKFSAAQEPDHQKLVQQQESLRQVIESISSELELRPLLTEIVRHACELLGAARGSVGLVDPAGPVMRTEAVFEMPEGELGSESPPGVGLAGAVLATGEPVVSGRYGDLDRPMRQELAEDAVIAIPIVWRDEVIGFVGIGADPPHVFDDGDVELLQLFARHASIAIVNARLIAAEKQRTTRIETISRVGQLITASLSTEDVLRTVVEAVRERLDCQSAGLLLVDPDNPEQLVLLDRSGWSTDYKVGKHVQSIDRGVVGAAATSRKALLIPDVSKDPRHFGFPGPGAERIRSEIAVPIEHSGRLLGVLNVESEAVLDVDDLAGLEIVADQLGIAIENARLFSESERALDEMQLLFETSRSLAVATDIESAIKAYFDKAVTDQAFGCEVAVRKTRLQGDEPEHSEILKIYREGSRRSEQSARALGGIQLAGDQLALAHEPQIEAISDVLELPDLRGGLREYALALGYRALAIVPLTRRDESLGALLLGHPQPRAWSATDLRPYELTASQLAIALESRIQQQRSSHRARRLAVIEERHRLARELHDSVSQLLFSMTLIAQSLETAWQNDPESATQRISRLLELSKTVRAEMRALLFELRPTETMGEPNRSTFAELERLGLVEMLRQASRQLAENRFEVRLEASDYQPQAFASEQVLLRIGQEALANVAKHARATRCEIVVAVRGDLAHLQVRDDGIGVDRNAKQAAGLGLKTMRERAEGAGGTFDIRKADDDGGTIVSILLPITSNLPGRNSNDIL